MQHIAREVKDICKKMEVSHARHKAVEAGFRRKVSLGDGAKLVKRENESRDE